MGFLAITLEFVQDCAGTLVQFTFQLKTLRNSSPIVGSVAHTNLLPRISALYALSLSRCGFLSLQPRNCFPSIIILTPLYDT